MSSQDPLILSFSHPHPLADADTSSCKLAKASLRGEGTPELASTLGAGPQRDSLSQPYPLADMATLGGKLAKASLRGEGWGKGV
jgi:hypothetical protein